MKARITTRLGRRIGGNREWWGRWEDRSHLRDHPDAVAGLRAAYVNRVLSVQVIDRATTWGPVLQVGVRRHDGSARVGWADLQRVKDELVGSARLAVQVFPPAARVVDAANMYWLWVLPVGMELPFDLRAAGPAAAAVAAHAEPPAAPRANAATTAPEPGSYAGSGAAADGTPSAGGNTQNTPGTDGKD